MHAHDLVLLKVIALLCNSNIFFLHLTTYCRTVTLTVTTRTPTPALHLGSPAPPSGGKISFLRRCTGRHMNWRRVKSMAFYDREMLRTLQKLPSSWPWRWAKGEVNRIFSCHGILWTQPISLLADHSYKHHRPMLPTFPRKSWQIVVNIDFSTTANCSFADSVIPFFLQLSRDGRRLTGENDQPKFMFKWKDT